MPASRWEDRGGLGLCRLLNPRCMQTLRNQTLLSACVIRIFYHFGHTAACKPFAHDAAVGEEPEQALRAHLHVVDLVEDDPCHLAQHLRPPAQRDCLTWLGSTCRVLHIDIASMSTGSPRRGPCACPVAQVHESRMLAVMITLCIVYLISCQTQQPARHCRLLLKTLQAGQSTQSSFERGLGSPPVEHEISRSWT